MIALIDYGMGNQRSVFKALETVGGEVVLSDSPIVISRAEAIVLPGVGAFHAGMEEMNKRGLVEPIKDSIKKGRPYLGICLGMQFLADMSREGDRKTKGFGIIKGEVLRFPEKDSDGKRIKVPQIGWNTITIKKKSVLLSEIPDETYFYFVHSYYFKCNEPEFIAGECEYGVRYAAAIEKDNIFATQFHPEKSQNAGLKILKNFINFCKVKNIR